MDAPKFRKGDKVIVEATVEYIHDGKANITLANGYTTAIVDVDKIDIITPFYKPGERVIHPNEGAGVVIATHDDMVWVDIDDGSLTTAFASDLTLETAPEPLALPAGEPSSEPIMPAEPPEVEF